MVRTFNRCVLVVVLLLASVSPSKVHATAQDKAIAESLYREGLAQMKEGNYQSACPKLAESQRLEPAVGTLLYLGECYEQLGLTASAWATFTAAIDAAKRVNNRGREQIAIERAATLADKVSRLTLVVPDEAQVAGLEVKQDGRVVAEAAWGVPLPIDPGLHVIEATAPGRQPWTKQVSIDITARAALTESVPVLEDIAPVPVPPPVSVRPSPVVSQPPVMMSSQAPNTADTGGSTRGAALQRRLGVALAGVGVVSIGFGTVFGLEARAKEKDSEAFCWSNDKTRCSHQGVALINDAKSLAVVADAGLIGGALAFIGGAVLYFTAPKAAQSTSATHSLKVEIVPEVSRARSSLFLQGSF